MLNELRCDEMKAMKERAADLATAVALIIRRFLGGDVVRKKSWLVIGLQSIIVTTIVLLICFSYLPGGAANKNLEAENADYFTLDMSGYNYTDHDIQEYSVNSQGGGNVSVSGLTSGGSGIVCCIQLPKKYSNIRLTIRWQVGGCVYTARDPFSSATQRLFYFYYREAKVTIPRPKSGKPVYLETHFYPDGSVQAQITQEISLPRLPLSDSRKKAFQYPTCKNDEKPE